MTEMDKKVLYDKDIREPLFDFLEEHYGKIRIFEEKNIGNARADVVMVSPEKLYGIEIKSDADSYTRLKKQVAEYDLYYDRNILVVGSSHALHAAEHVPEWWGIISVELEDNKQDFYVIREASDNPKVVSEKKIQILWRPELNHLLEKNGLPKYKQKSKWFVQDYLIEKVEAETLWPAAYEELFERDYNTIGKEIAEYRSQKKTKVKKNKRKKKGLYIK